MGRHAMSLATCIWLAGLGLAATTRAQDGADRLEQAVYQEETVGDVDRAIELYRAVANDEQVSESLRNQAQTRLASSLRKKGQVVLTAAQAPDQPPRDEEPRQPNVGAAISEIADFIEKNYAFELNRQQLVEATLQALLKNLEGDSAYISREEFQELSRSFDQQLVGIGVQLALQDGQLVVVAPVPGSPSEKAGIRPGDRVIAAGETKFAELPEAQRLVDAVKLLRGRAGESVTLEIQSAGADDSRKVTVERAAIQIESVRGDTRSGEGEWNLMVDAEQKIGYVRILQFGARTAAEVEAAVGKLRQQGARALVLDLRGNPGGMVQEAVKVADLFLREGKILTVRSQGDKQQTIEAKADGTIEDLPIAVLIDRYTASAAEIVAASLQDHKRAALVGERTYGQGVVRSLIPVQSTGGAVRLATGVWVRPSGQSIYRSRAAGGENQPANTGGVSPNEGLELKLADAELEAYRKYRSARDVGRGENEEPAVSQDKQLAKAVSYLREQLSQ